MGEEQWEEHEREEHCRRMVGGGLWPTSRD